MKEIISILFFLMSLYLYGQSANDTLNNRIKYLIEKKRNEELSKSEISELRNYGYSIQNKGFLLVENNSDYQNALIPIDSAISFWISIGDMGNEANLRKYKGMILGNLNRFEEGKKEIRQALALYKGLKIDFGVAVSQYNMSLLYDIENKPDSALSYQKRATEFWMTKKDTSRIFSNNTHLIHLYTRIGDYSKAEEIQRVNELFHKTNEHWHPVINFYYVSYIMFDKVKNKGKADSFKDFYIKKLQELESNGITTKSIYDRN